VAFNYSDGIFLWSRTMSFADCAVIKPPAYDDMLCPSQPAADRPSASTFIWEPGSPLNALPGPKFSPRNNALALHFAIRAIAAQPVEYAKDVLDDFALTFTWNRPPHPSALLAERSQFAFATNNWEPAGTAGALILAKDQRAYTGGSLATTRAVQPFASFMRGYQRVFSIRGTILGVLLLIGLAGIVRAWAGGGLRRRRDWGGPVLFPWTAAFAMLLLPNVTADFSERYAVPAMPAVCLAAALAFVSVRRGAATLALADGTLADGGPTHGGPDGSPADDGRPAAGVAAGDGAAERESPDTATATAGRPATASSRELIEELDGATREPTAWRPPLTARH
jgi:hypothetical protein